MDPSYFNPSTYQNVPASEVNWAQLAQRWIMARNTAPVNTAPAPRPLMGGLIPPPAFPSPFTDPRNLPPRPFPPQGIQGMPHMPVLPAMPPILPGQSPIPNALLPTPPMGGFYTTGAVPPVMPPVMPPSMPPRGIPPPPPARHAAPSTSNVEQKYDDEEEQYGAHFDPSLMTDDTVDQNEDDEGAMSHWISGMTSGASERDQLPSDWMAPSWMPSAPSSTSGIPSLMSLPFLDQQARKKLPAWILEGLEKAEKEKQKKLEREERLREAEKIAKLRQEQRAALGLSKFDSDSEAESDKDHDEEAPAYETKNLPPPDDGPVFLAKNNQVAEAIVDVDERSSESEEDNEAKKEELRQIGLLSIRRLMTSVLLECTDEETHRIANQVYSESKSRAQPKILVQSSALAAISALGGGDSDSSDAEEEPTDEPTKPDNHAENGRPENGAHEEATFKTPLLPVVSSKIRSGELGNSVGKSSTTEDRDDFIKPKVESRKEESVEKLDKYSNRDPKRTDNDRDDRYERHRSKRSRSRSRERSSKRDDEKRREDRRREKDDDRRRRHDSPDSAKKRRRHDEDRRKRSRSRERSNHGSRKHSRRSRSRS